MPTESHDAPSLHDAMRRMTLFAKVADTDLDDVIRHAQVREFGRGESLFQRGDPARRFFGVLAGWVKVYNRDAHGEEAVLGLFTAGETFAEAAMFMGDAYPASAETVDAARLMVFERDYFEREMARRPALGFGVMAAMAAQLKRLTREVEQLQTRTGEERLARFLLNLCDGDQGSCRVSLPYDKSLIAGRLGMKAETLSRNFAKLRRRGIEVNGHTVLIPDPTALRALYP